MTEPFRETAIPTVDGNEALAILEKKEPLSLAFLIAFFGKSLYAPARGEPVALNGFREQAERAGFVYAGVYTFAGLVGRPTRERWIHPSGLASLSMRSAGGGPVERTMSRYYISSTFDDGSAIVTWSKAPPLSDTSRAQQRAGKEHIANDYAAHIDAVRAHAEERQLRVLRIDDLDTALRASLWYDSRLFTSMAMLHLQKRVLIVAAIIFVAYTLAQHVPHGWLGAQ